MTERRSAAFEKTIKSAAAMRAWQQERREFFLRQIGGLPERTPLNPQIVGTLQGKGCRVEKIILETQPGCFLTTFRKLIETRGPQDGEQNIAGQIAFGMDEADYCIMRAPRPTLICAGTRDVTFDFNGTMDVFREAKRFYSRLGFPERLDIAAPDAPHGFTIQRGDCTIRKLALTAAPGVRIPALAFMPPKASTATLYLHGTSMKADAAATDALVARGHLVLAAELRGIGETETGHDKRAFGAGRSGPDNLESLTAYLMGMSFVGMRTGDVLAWTRHLQSIAPGISSPNSPAATRACSRSMRTRFSSLRRPMIGSTHGARTLRP